MKELFEIDSFHQTIVDNVARNGWIKKRIFLLAKGRVILETRRGNTVKDQIKYLPYVEIVLNSERRVVFGVNRRDLFKKVRLQIAELLEPDIESVRKQILIGEPTTYPMYLLTPGYVTSKNDGQKHFIDAQTLANIYGVSMKDCVVKGQHYKGPRPTGMVLLLEPREDGIYNLNHCKIMAAIP